MNIRHIGIFGYHSEFASILIEGLAGITGSGEYERVRSVLAGMPLSCPVEGGTLVFHDLTKSSSVPSEIILDGLIVLIGGTLDMSTFRRSGQLAEDPMMLGMLLPPSVDSRGWEGLSAFDDQPSAKAVIIAVDADLAGITKQGACRESDPGGFDFRRKYQVFLFKATLRYFTRLLHIPSSEPPRVKISTLDRDAEHFGGSWAAEEAGADLTGRDSPLAKGQLGRDPDLPA